MTTITKRFFLSTLTGAAMLALGATAALAGEPLKIGMVLPMSGPFASYGKQIESGARLYLAQSGGTFSGRKVELIIKDDTGVAPEISKRAAQELVVKDKVDILAGFGLTPSAFAVAPIATEAKKPMIVMNAATSAITTKSEYILRVSHTLPQVTAPIASWAAKNKIKKVFTLVADFGPGLDAAAQFKKTFTAAGGEVVGEVRTPVKSPDFAPFLQKIKDAAPEAVFLFVPPGEQTIAFIKGFAERDLAKAGIRNRRVRTKLQLNSAAPAEMSPEPPTIALFGYTPNGGKNACIEPPRPRLKPALRPKISASAPYTRKSTASSFTESITLPSAHGGFIRRRSRSRKVGVHDQR